MARVMLCYKFELVKNNFVRLSAILRVFLFHASSLSFPKKVYCIVLYCVTSIGTPKAFNVFLADQLETSFVV